MKKIVLIGLALMSAFLVSAQDFPVDWKTKFGFKPDRWFYDDNAKYIVGRTDEEAEVLDGATGKSIWKVNFKNDLKVKSLSRATYNASEGVVLFFNADEKKKGGEKVVLDLATGKQLWRTDQYAGIDADQNYHFANNLSAITSNHVTIVFNDATKKFTGVDVRTGAVKWESKAYPDVSLEKNVIISPIENSEFAQIFLTDEEDVLKTQILYMSIVTGELLADDSRFSSASGDFDRSYSGKIVSRRIVGGTTIDLTGKMSKLGMKIRFELKASGSSTWKTSFESSAVRELFGDDPYVKLDVQGDKIFVISKEITVLDLATGNKLWSAPFDNCDASAGLKAKQEFGIAGWPLVSGDVIYYVDLQNDNAIKKVEGKTGKVIWKSEKLKSNDRVPNLILVNGVLVAQFGGMINTQIYIPNSNGGSVTKSEFRFDGNYGVNAYDPASGKMIWSTAQLAGKLGDKFSDRISTIYPLNNKIVVASDKNLFSLEPKTGDVVYKTSLSASKIGDMFEVRVSEDFETLFIFCDNGVASANASTGKLNYATKTGEIEWALPPGQNCTFNQGKNLFVWVGDEDFIGFDMASGKVKGKMEGNNNPQMTADGNAILLRDGDKLTRFAVNR